jgi:hypothetical protein
VRRQLTIAGKPLSTTELAKRTPLSNRYHAKYVYVAAKRFAVPLYRYHNARGRPIVWRLK